MVFHPTISQPFYNRKNNSPPRKTVYVLKGVRGCPASVPGCSDRNRSSSRIRRAILLRDLIALVASVLKTSNVSQRLTCSVNVSERQLRTRKPRPAATVANGPKPPWKQKRHAPHGNAQRRESESGNRSPSLNLQNGHRWNRPWKLQRSAQPANVQRPEAASGNRSAMLNPRNRQRRKLQLEIGTSRSTWKRSLVSSQAANVTLMEAAPPWQRLNWSAAPRAIATASR